MAFEVNNSIFTRIQQNVSQAAERIGSGLRINSAADDAAGLAISSRFTSRIDGLSQAVRNTSDGISFSQTASGDLGSVTESLQRIRELAVQSANGSLNDSDREALNQEATQLREQIQSVVERSNFNGQPLLSASESTAFQVGADAGEQVVAEAVDLQQTLEDIAFDELDISSAEGAASALETVDELQQEVVAADTEFGALTNRFEAASSQLQIATVNAEASRSQIRDADIAREAANFIQGQVQQQASIAVQAQANQQSALVLRLLT